ncbi:MAG: hypothetical protein MNPFHGCM_01376 [Gemmatimonadaceae bacterium]|nr:hypothetical protein [Gemmatimonadaceae bacterium]
MTLPIVPTSPTLVTDAGHASGTPDSVGRTSGAPFAEVLGSALGVGAGAMASPAPPSLLALLLAGSSRMTPADGARPMRTGASKSSSANPERGDGLPSAIPAAGDLAPRHAADLSDETGTSEAAVESGGDHPLLASVAALLATSTGVHSSAARTATAANPSAVNRDVGALVPDIRARLEKLIDRMRNEFGYTVEVVETVRSQARQDALFAQGRTTPGPVVTWTRSSPHLEGRAADVMIDGGFENVAAFRRLAELAREVGLRTLWPRDPGHVEIAAGTTAAVPRIPEDALTRAGIRRLDAASRPIAPLTIGAEPSGSVRTQPVQPNIGQQGMRARPEHPLQSAAEAQPNVSGSSQPLAPDIGRQVRNSSGEHQAWNAPRVARVDTSGKIATGPQVTAAGQVSAGLQVASVAQVAAVAQVATVARVAPVSRRAIGASASSHIRGTTEDAAWNADGRLQSATVAKRVGPPAADQQSVDVSPTPAFPAGDNVERVLEAIDAQLVRSANRHGASRDEGSAEVDPVAAAREQLDNAATGLTRSADLPFASRSPAIVGAGDAAPVSLGDRIARIFDARDAAAERPLSSVVLRLDHPHGGEDRIRVDLRGQSVSASFEVRDPIVADRLAAHAPELSRALSQHGLDAEHVTIRAMRADASVAALSGAIAERDAVRGSTSSSASNDSSYTGRDARDPSRPHDHQHGDAKQRGRRDSRGSR